MLVLFYSRSHRNAFIVITSNHIQRTALVTSRDVAKVHIGPLATVGSESLAIKRAMAIEHVCTETNIRSVYKPIEYSAGVRHFPN